MSTPVRPEVSAEQIEARLERLRMSIDVQSAAEAFQQAYSATYTARDPEHLVTAEVSGNGIVEKIRLGSTAMNRPPEIVEQAVLAAIAAAQAQGRSASHAITEQLDRQTQELAAATAEYERTVLEPLRRQADAVEAEMREAIQWLKSQ
ncbi:MAG TPA: YbaB/EbfC family nucleoid-associated protein [Micromonosporaceae bacterium]|jgi:DNA-binding protein YbaB